MRRLYDGSSLADPRSQGGGLQVAGRQALLDVYGFFTGRQRPLLRPLASPSKTRYTVGFLTSSYLLTVSDIHPAVRQNTHQSPLSSVAAEFALSRVLS